LLEVKKVTLPFLTTLKKSGIRYIDLISYDRGIKRWQIGEDLRGISVCLRLNTNPLMGKRRDIALQRI